VLWQVSGGFVEISQQGRALAATLYIKMHFRIYVEPVYPLVISNQPVEICFCKSA
jgi:hypothetical protein